MPAGMRALSIWWDAVLTLACSLALLILILFVNLPAGFSGARLVLGIVYVFFVPGYWLHALLFPHRKAINATERVGISLGLSVALIPLLALVLDRSPWGLHLWPVLIAELGFGLLFMLTSVWQRVHLGMDEAYFAELHFHPLMVWRSLARVHRIAFFLAVAVIFIFPLIAARTFFMPVQDSYLTEFFILSKDQKSVNFPRTAQLDESLQLNLGIANLERSEINYRVEIWVKDSGNPEEKRCVGTYGPYKIKRGQSTGNTHRVGNALDRSGYTGGSVPVSQQSFRRALSGSSFVFGRNSKEFSGYGFRGLI